MKRYADIIVDISHEKVDRSFAYRIPEHLQAAVHPGVRVKIPFGAGNTLRTGYVTEVKTEVDFPDERIKEINSVLTGAKEPEEKMIELAAWMKEQYGSTMIQALKTVLPARKKVALLEKKKISLAVSIEAASAFLQECERKHQTAKVRLLKELVEQGELPWELVTKKLNIPASTVKSLEDAGIITKSSTMQLRNPVKLGALIGAQETAVEAKTTVVGAQETAAKAQAGAVAKQDGRSPAPLSGGRKILSPAQRHIIESILSEYDSGIYRTSLIHGITGSGKTEVYLALIEGMIERGKQAIVLIPEIALTYQTLLRFYRRFGDRVSVMNSTLSPGEKQDQCERARKGEIDVIIGPRSALFVPFPNLGMILIDEEHENSYKSETSPRYHARETAIKLAQMSDAAVVLGSATPSLEAYSRAVSGEYNLFTLKVRLTGGSLPDVYVEDLRKELAEGNRSIFSYRLQEKLRERLDKKEQSMLFLNRRGYAGFISCRSCGYVVKCPHCDVSLSEHKNGRLICHYCGYSQPSVKLCPSCGSRYILGFKAGTEQIEEQICRMFPDAKVLRMDADTTRTKESYEKILSAFANKEADILVGTQMIVKGHDFADVTLVGILAADLSLSAADYRAGERTFQLLTQAAGRAGRGEKPGEVVIQTYQPEHYSIRFAAAQDYEGFYREEITYRQLLSYPPASHILSVQLTAKKEEEAAAAAKEAAEIARRAAAMLLAEEALNKEEQTESAAGDMAQGKASVPDTIVIGPAPALIGKINDIYRYGVYIRNKDYQKLVAIKDEIERFRSGQEKPKGNCQFDFDAVNTF